MHRYLVTIYGVIGALVLIGGVGAQAHAAGPCLTEVLIQDMQVTATLADRMLDYRMEKGSLLAAIPEAFVNKRDTSLNKDFQFLLPFTRAGGIHTLRKPLVVETPDGRQFRLREGTEFSYTLPEAVSGYHVTLPERTSLTRIDGTEPPEYRLAEDITVAIAPPKNSIWKLTVPAQRVVDRVPGTSTMGTTLTFKPRRAPVGEYITLTVAKSEFDFSKAQFYVCLRKRGEEKAEKETRQNMKGTNPVPFIPSTDVELIAVQMGQARLRVRIPDISESGPHRAKPVDLLVVARGPNGRMAEGITRGFAVSSRALAAWCWGLAIFIPWLITKIITGLKEPKKWNRVDPIWLVSGKYGNASLSLAQVLLWTILVFSASFYVLVVSGKLLDLTNEVLMLLGIAGGSSVIAKIAASTKSDKGVTIVAPAPKDPKWLDLFQTEGRPDLYKVQMALFTTLAAIFVTFKIYGTLVFPELPAGLLTLIGISNGVYLGAKATSKTVFEKLAAKSNELNQAGEELKTLTAAAAKAQNDQQTAESELTEAIKERDRIKAEWEQETDTAKKSQLKELFEQRKIAAKMATEHFEAAAERKKEADEAKKAAANKLKELKTAFKKLKDEALK